MAKNPDKATLRKVARILREQKIGAPLDARSELRGSMVRGGKSLREWAKKLQPILDERAAIVPTKSTSEKGYRKLYERAVVVNQKTKKKSELYLVPHSVDEKVVIKDGKVTITHPAGIERMQVPVDYHKLDQWLSEAQAQKYGREKGVQYGFRFFGGSSNVYRTMDLLLQELENYRTVQEAVEGSAKFQREVYRNIEIVRIADTKTWRKQQAENKKRKRRKQ